MSTICDLWLAASSAERPYPAFLFEESGSWREIGWGEAAVVVDELAAGFAEFGVESGERVAILAATRVEWTLCDLALISIGAVTVPIYPTSSALECAYILGNAGVSAIVCENAEQYAKIAPLRSRLDFLDMIVTIEGAPGSAVGLDEVRERGRNGGASAAAAVATRRAAASEGDVLTIIYTSGTTGPPKGCVITHGNFSSMVDMVGSIPDFLESGDRVLLYLPLAHNFARLVQFAGIGVGFTVAFCADMDRIPGALLEVSPTILPSVPRLFEKVMASVSESIEQTSGAKRRLADWAFDVGARAARHRQAGERVPAPLALQRSAADKLVFSKIKARLGGSLRFAVSGGAPLGTEVAEFFDALGLLILEGYGLTECTSASHVNRPGRYRFGTVGLPVPGLEAQAANDGEILLRGPMVFAGYHGDEKGTREVLSEEGWLHTGDIGSIDAEGFLTITDRKKDVIITAGGKNVSPQNIENALRASRYVAQALVIGDRRPFLTALVAIDRDEAAKVAHSADEISTLVEKAVAEVNRDLARPEQIKRFSIVPRDFLPEEGEVTPTLKLRRHVCEEHFAAEIAAMYSNDP